MPVKRGSQATSVWMEIQLSYAATSVKSPNPIAKFAAEFLCAEYQLKKLRQAESVVEFCPPKKNKDIGLFFT